jgi:hypothetical protein
MLEAIASWSKVRLWWTLTIGYVFAAEIAKLLAARIPPCVVQTQIGKQPNGTEYEYCPALHEMLPIIGAFLEDHSEAFTALSTIAIALFTWTLWQSSEKMWRITKVSADHIPLVERAYVFGGPGLRGVDPDTGRQTIVLTIGNYGGTPAFLETIEWGTCAPNEWPMETFPHVVPYEDILFPHTGPATAPAFYLPDGEATHIFYGRFTYRDVL